MPPLNLPSHCTKAVAIFLFVALACAGHWSAERPIAAQEQDERAFDGTTLATFCNALQKSESRVRGGASGIDAAMLPCGRVEAPRPSLRLTGNIPEERGSPCALRTASVPGRGPPA